MRLNHRVRTSAAPERVWDVLERPADWPQITPWLRRVEGGSEPVATDQRLLAVGRGVLRPRIPLDVLEVVRAQRLVVRSHTLPGLTEQLTVELTPTTRGGTDVAVSTVVDGPFAVPACVPSWCTAGVTARLIALRVDHGDRLLWRAGAA